MRRRICKWAAIALAAWLVYLSADGEISPLECALIVRRDLGFYPSGAEILYAQDTHGGPHGDGDAKLVMRLKANDRLEKRFSENPGWHPLPLPDELAGAHFAGLFQGVAGLENGWYYFYDRNDFYHRDGKAEDRYDFTGLHDQLSYNYTAAVYDADTNILCYLAVDT